MTTTSTPSATSPPPTSPPAPALPATASLAAILRAVIAKELRRNAITPIILLGIMAAAACAAAYFQMTFENAYIIPSSVINLLFLPVIQLTVALVFPAAGFILGCMQIRGENALVDWAFLIHRPVPRLILFLGRILAGMILYLAAAGLPLLLLLAFSSTSAGGQFFYWRFALPSLADFFAGFIFYLAALLIAQSTRTLVGPRMLPLVAAAACSFSIRAVDSFAAASLVSAAFALVLLAAAFGSFHSQGFNRRPPRIAHAARLLLTCFSLAALLGSAFFLSQIALQKTQEEQETALYNQHPSFTPLPARTFTRRILLPDGTLVNRIVWAPAVTTRPTTATTDDPRTRTTYATLDGTPLPNLTPPIAEPETGNANNREIIVARTPSVEPPSYGNLPASIFTMDVWPSQPDEKPTSPERWFYVRRQALFYIYRAKPHAFLGTFGQNGFAPPGQKAQPFAAPVTPYGPTVTPREILQILPESHTVKTLFTAPPGESLLAIDSADHGIAVVASDKHIFLFRPDDPRQGFFYPGSEAQQTLSATLPITHPLDQFIAHLQFLPQDLRWAIWYTPRHRPASSGPAFVELFEFTGTPIRQTKLDWFARIDPLFTAAPISPQQQVLAHRWQVIFGTFDGLIGLTGPFAALSLLPPIQYLTGTPLILFASAFATSSAMTLLCFFLLRRYACSMLPSLPWLLAILLLGLPVLLTFLVTQSLPRRLPCVTCGKRRPHEERLCPHCQAPWPDPPQTGTEIFA